jgi:hypothetical protein
VAHAVGLLEHRRRLAEEGVLAGELGEGIKGRESGKTGAVAM